MYIINKTRKGISSLPVKEINNKQIKTLGSELAQRILEEIAKNPSYPMELAKKLRENEQKIYYHIRNLEEARIIEVTKTEIIQGAKTNYYSLTQPAFVIKYKEFRTTQKITELEKQPKSFLEPIIEDGQLNAVIIVGSPDPHGHEKARSRDGYYGIDLALFLGTFLNYIPNLNVKLDTEARAEDLEKNIVLIGGPVVNTITAKINDKLPIKFDKQNNWNIVSTLSNKVYHTDETGVIAKIKNPFNPKKLILLVAGKRHSGTRAVIIALLKYFNEIIKGNKYHTKILARVVEGIDLNSDGIVDEVEILE
jgi:DNA-binding transcriptional ArsR family regulator